MLNVVFDGLTKRNMQFNGKCVENGVVCIGYSLDIGDIRSNDLIYGRKDEFRRLELSEYDGSRIDNAYTEYAKDAGIFLQTVEARGDLRIWRSREPHNICAFAFLCDIIYKRELNVYCVDLPHGFPSWGLLESRRYTEMLSEAYPLTDRVINEYRGKWIKLKAKNAPLRAVINGEIASVTEDFYDYLIEDNIPPQGCSVGELLGRIAKDNKSGVSLNWILIRIKELTKAEKLETKRVNDRNELDNIIRFN